MDNRTSSHSIRSSELETITDKSRMIYLYMPLVPKPCSRLSLSRNFLSPWPSSSSLVSSLSSLSRFPDAALHGKLDCLRSEGKTTGGFDKGGGRGGVRPCDVKHVLKLILVKHYDTLWIFNILTSLRSILASTPILESLIRLTIHFSPSSLDKLRVLDNCPISILRCKRQITSEINHLAFSTNSSAKPDKKKSERTTDSATDNRC